MTARRAINQTWQHLSRFIDADRELRGLNRARRVFERGHSSGEQSSRLSLSHVPFYVFKLPKLSPIMQSARIQKWHISAGDDVAEPQLAVTLIPDQLETLNSLSEERPMQVEIHEEGVMAVILKQADPHTPVACGTALALICDPDDVADIQTASRSGHDLVPHATRETAWQAFFAS